MPGSIQVTVLELMDLPSPPPLSSFSLKVFMGKREYHNVGGGELSFQLMSLQENLIVVLHDAEGEEILKTEFRTRLLLERGFWDTLFPLKNGGSLHMKLQFLLSAEDRKRIHEMRDSALKKRCMEKPMIRHRRSLSDNRIGDSVTKSIAESITDEILLGHSEPTYPEAHCLAERTDERQHPSDMVLHQSLDCSKSIVIRNINKHSSSSVASLEKYKYCNTESKKVKDRVSNNIVKDTINIFENHTCQGIVPYLGQREKFFARGIAAGGPHRSALAGERDIGNLKCPQIMSKLFSSKIFSQVCSEEKCKQVESFFLKKKCDAQTVIPSMGYGMLVSKDLEIDKKSCKVEMGLKEIRLRKGTYSHTNPVYSPPSNSSMTIDKTVDTGRSTVLVVSAETSGIRKDFATVNVENAPSTRPTLLNHIAVGENEKLNLIQKEGDSLDLKAASGIFVSRHPSHSAELRASGAELSTDSNSIDMRGDENATLSGGVNRKREVLDVNKNKNEQVCPRGKSFPLKSIVDELETIEHPYQYCSLVEVAKTVSDESTSQTSSNECDASDEPSNAGNKHNSRNQSVDGNASSFKEVNIRTETLGANESNNEEKSDRDKSLTLDKMVDDSKKIEHLYQHGSSDEVARTVSDDIMPLIPSCEPSFPGSSYEKAREFNYCYSSVCHIGLLGTWPPRRLCITTGNNLLRNIAESCTVSVETFLIDNSSQREADAKEQEMGIHTYKAMRVRSDLPL